MVIVALVKEWIYQDEEFNFKFCNEDKYLIEFTKENTKQNRDNMLNKVRKITYPMMEAMTPTQVDTNEPDN